MSGPAAAVVAAVVLLAVVAPVSPSMGDNDTVLYIGGIFPINGTSGWQGGQACLPSALMAMEDVNKSPNLLVNYRLNLVWNDSQCEPGLGAAVMYDLLYNAPKKHMLLGGCSTVSTTIGEAARMWNLVVVSYGSSSPALSDRKRFPTFFRTHPSATVHNPTRVKLMKKFGWSRIAVLQQTEEVFISTVEDLELECKKNGIEIEVRQSFLNDPADAVKNLKRHDVRIVIGLFYVVAARRVLCEIYKNNLFGRSNIYFFIGWYENAWYERHLEEEKLNCTVEQMRMAAEGHLTTEAIMWNRDDKITISGMRINDFKKRLDEQLIRNGYDLANQHYPAGYQEAPLAYDAIWSMALALNVTIERLKSRGETITDFTYSNKYIADEIYNAMNATQFLGVSGRVAFNTDGSRIAWTQVEQLIDGQYVKLGYYDVQTDNLTWHDRERWIGGKVPPDRTIIRSELRLVSLPLFIAMCTISGLGIIVCLALLIFTCINSRRRTMRMSHPTCNNITLVGAIMCFMSVCLLGLDGRFVTEDQFPHVCSARAWVLSVGFSLAYGSMFSKIWRVHRLATKVKAQSKIRVEPWKLYVMVACILAVDVVVLGAWQGADSMYRKLETFPLEVPQDTDDDVKIKPQLEHCHSTHNSIWLGVVYSYKGLLLIFGLFLAYETRSVKMEKINDSRLVGMSIYNVAILCIITAPVTLLISSQQDASFAFASLSVIFCCFLSMALIFVPKVVEVAHNPRERVDSTGDNAPSREEEERYQKLIAENDDMQRLITEKDAKIRSLKQTIEQKKLKALSSGNDVTSTETQPRLRQGMEGK